MTKPKGYIPKHCHHKGTGQGYVRFDGKPFYTGKWGTPASEVEYDRLIREFLRNGRVLPPQHDGDSYLIEDLVSDYWTQFKAEHPGPGAADPMKFALAPLLEDYGKIDAFALSPINLLDLREELVCRGLSRNTINGRMTMLKRMFRWGVVRQLFPAEVHLQIAAIEGLKRGQSKAKESKKVQPVDPAHVEAVFPFVSRQVGDMVRLQLLTGMRPGEVLIMGCRSVLT